MLADGRAGGPQAFADGLEQAHDAVEVVVVLLDLGALVGVEDVLLHQGMESEAAADLAEDGRVLQAIDVEPQLLPRGGVATGFLQGGEAPLLQPFGVKLDEGDGRACRLDLADMDQAARGQAGLAQGAYQWW